MMNATGCMELSGNGLRAMVRGLNFVELASSFYGFKPVEEVGRRCKSVSYDAFTAFSS